MRKKREDGIWKGFIDFIREKGVIGLAVGIILGSSVTKLVTAIVTDLINPILGVILGAAKGFESFTITIGPAKFMIGNFISALIDFSVVALVVYFGITALKLDKLDKKKDK